MTEKPELYIGRGNVSQQDEYMDFINYVFGFNGDGSDFYKLLPKLYKREYDPCASNYVVTENGKMKAAVGAYDSVISIAGTKFKRRGIGNVAVHPFSRSKGYMKATMNMAVNDMVADGVAISDLGGRRQRYGYFSYEKACVHRSFHISESNLRHVYGDRPPMDFTFEAVKKDDAEALDAIFALNEAMPIHMVREREKLYDILINWRDKPCVIKLGGSFFGYLIRAGKTVRELTLTDDDLAAEVIFALMKSDGRDDMNIVVPLYKPKQAAAFADLAEDVDIEHGEMISVFDFKNVVDALMRLSAEVSPVPLADGEITLLIHGFAGDERFTVAVKDGVPSVEQTSREPDVELTHKRAISMLFGMLSPERDTLNGTVRSWFPLPITILSADAV